MAQVKTQDRARRFDPITAMAVLCFLAAVGFAAVPAFNAGPATRAGLMLLIGLFGVACLGLFALPVASIAGAFLATGAVMLLARKGAFCDAALRSERVTRDEAISAIRSNGGRGIEDVDFIILESDGTMSVGLLPGQ